MKKIHLSILIALILIYQINESHCWGTGWGSNLFSSFLGDSG
jgi:hypothetical protein